MCKEPKESKGLSPGGNQVGQVLILTEAVRDNGSGFRSYPAASLFTVMEVGPTGLMLQDHQGQQKALLWSDTATSSMQGAQEMVTELYELAANTYRRIQRIKKVVSSRLEKGGFSTT